jgi:hypothetical protein
MVRKIPDHWSVYASKNLSIFNPKIVSKLPEIWSGMFIPDPDLDLLPIPDPGSRGQKSIGSRIRIHDTASKHVLNSIAAEKITNLCFLMVNKLSTQIGFDGVRNWEQKFSCLGSFKWCKEEVNLLPIDFWTVNTERTSKKLLLWRLEGTNVQ